VQMLSKFSKNFREIYLKAVKRVFCCLKNTQNLWLTYKEAGENFARFTDTDGNIAEDCYATSGHTFIINSGTIF